MNKLIKDINKLLDCDLKSKRRDLKNTRGRYIFIAVCKKMDIKVCQISKMLNLRSSSILHYLSIRYKNVNLKEDLALIKMLFNNHGHIFN